MSKYGAFLDAEEQRVQEADTAAVQATGAAPAPAGPSKYGAFLDQAEAIERTRQRATLRSAAGVNPDDAAEARRLATRYPAPSDVLLRNLQDVKLQDTVDRADDRLLTSPKLADMVKNAPGFAQVAHDDIHELANLEERIAQFGQIRASEGPAPSVLSVIRGLGTNFTQGADLARQGIRQAFGDAIGSSEMSEDAARKAAGARTKIAIADPAFESDTARGVYAGGAGLLRNIPGLAASIATRSVTPGLATAGVQTGAEAYTEVRARGGSGGQAALSATGQALVEMGTEALPMGFLVKQFGRTGAGEFLTGLLVREIPSEQLNTVVADAIDTAIANPDKTWQQYLDERPGAAYQTLLATLVQSGAMGGASAVARRLTGDEGKAEQAQLRGEALARVMDAAEKSKLRERDPQAFGEAVQRMADEDFGDTLPSMMYVDGIQFAQLLAKLPEEDQERLAAAMPKTMDALAEAAETGGDLAIPLGEYAQMAGTTLAQQVNDLARTDPGAWSKLEAEEFKKQGAQRLRAEAERVVAESEQRAEMEQQLASVRDELLGQLKKVRRFTEDVNQAYATLAADFYTVTAARAGMKPADLYKQFPLRIVAEDVSRPGRQLTQSQRGGKSPEFRKWFGASTVVDQDGKPLVVYHGSPDARFVNEDGVFATMKERMLRFGNTPESKRAAKEERAFFFTSSRHVASTYADDRRAFDYQNAEPEVIPTYLALQNPLVFDAGGKHWREAQREMSKEDFIKEAKRKGHDGVVIRNVRDSYASLDGGSDPVSDVYVAFESSQIKHAERNDGSFDADDPSILSQGERGTFSPDTNTIALLANADLSTFLHELGHFQLEVMAQLASQPGAPEQIVADMKVLLDWFGFKGDVAAWLGQSLDTRREAHEKFARGFEAYLFEGKAPSVELQGIFQRFAAWLKQVYKSLTALRVELTDEVRGVMNRMLATDEQIAEAEAAAGYMPMFETAEAAGMTPQQFIAYQALGEKATTEAAEELRKRSLRDMKWLSNAKGRELKRLQAEADAKRKAIRAEVAAEVGRMPVYAAENFLRRGVLPDMDLTNAQRKASEAMAGMKVKLDLDALKAMYGEDPAAPWRYLDTGKAGLAANNGVHPDLVATLLGFKSGDALVRELLAAQPQAEVIDGMTDQRMLRHGDLADPQALDRAAEAAVHNEARGRFLAAELKALEEMVNVREATGTRRTRDGRTQTTSVNVYTRAAKQFARAAIGAKKIRDIRPSQYVAAEARAARAAAAAHKKGETQEAAVAKRNEVLNHYAGREAAEALAEVDKSVAWLLGINRDGLDADYVDQVDAILDKFDLRKSQSLKAIDKRKSLAKWVEDQRALGFEPTVEPDLIDAAQRTHFRDLSVDDFRAVVDTVRNIVHLGRLKKKLLTAKDQREFEAVVADASDSIRANARKSRSKKYADERTRAGEMFHGVLAMHRKFASLVREMDGFKDGGVLWERFVRPMNEAGDREAVMREQATVALTKLFKGFVNPRAKVHVPEIGDTLTREQIVSIALNWGNADNRARVMQGDGWPQAQVDAILSHMTKADWDFVQSVWDHIDTYWPDIAAKERRLTGKTPEKVEATEVVTPHGTYRGGYYPIKYDPAKSTQAEAQSAAEVAKQMLGGAFTRATTRRGHTKERVDEVKGRPIRKDIGVVFEHVNQVAHDIAWHEWLIDAQRLLRAKPIDAAIREHYGPEVLRELRKGIEDMAAGDIPAQDDLERAMNHIRTGTTVAGLAWNLTTSLLQPIGLTQSMVRVGPVWVARGLVKWLGGAVTFENTAKEIYAKSSMMRLRGKTMQRELNEILNTVKGEKLGKVKASFFFMIQQAQKVADIPTWLGAYEKAIAEGNAEERAAALADQAVLDAQGGGQIKDLARVQRGGPLLKLWTNFYSFFNVLHNLSAESVNRASLRDPASIVKLASDYLLLYTFPAAIVTVLRHLLTGGEDDEEELAKKLVADQLTYMTGTMVGVREVSAGIQGAMGLYSDYSGPAGARFFGELAKLGKQAGQGEADEAFLKALNNTAGILLHYPSGQVQRTVLGFEALSEGKTQNPLALLVGPPKE